MKLSGRQIEQIRDALLGAYPTPEVLSMMVRIELDEDLAAIANGENQRVLTFNLVTWAERNGRVDALIAGAYHHMPGNPTLQELTKQWRPQLSSDVASGLTSPLQGATRSSGPASIDLFLSYSREDRDTMRQVLDALREAGLAVWTDEGLQPGTQSWQDAITEALNQAQAVVVILSPSANASTWVKREITFAQTQGKRVFPLLIAGDEVTSVPLSLIEAQRVDGREDLHKAVSQHLIPVLRPRLTIAADNEFSSLSAVEQRTAVSAPRLPERQVTKSRTPDKPQPWRMYRWFAGVLIIGALVLFAMRQFSPPPQPSGPLAGGPTSSALSEEAALVLPASQVQPQQTFVPITLNFVDGLGLVQDTVSIDQPMAFQFVGTQGQRVRVQLSSQPAGVTFEVKGSDNIVYKSFVDASLDWSLDIPVSQNYLITVDSVPKAVFTLVVTLGGDTTTPQAEFIRFALGHSSVVVSGTLQSNMPTYYVVNAKIGQQMQLLLTSLPEGSANYAVNGVRDGFSYKKLTDPARDITISIPTSQDYLITLLSNIASAFELEVTLPPPLPIVPGCTNTWIRNNGFESDEFWTLGDDAVPPSYTSVIVHSGLRAVRLGIDPALSASVKTEKNTSNVCQPFQIPIEASIAQLRWWSFNRTEESQSDNPGSDDDKQEVVLLNTDLSTYDVLSSVRRNNNAWVESLVDLTSYRGKSFMLCFRVYNNGNGQRTWQIIDDVALTACFPGDMPPLTPVSTVVPCSCTGNLYNCTDFGTQAEAQACFDWCMQQVGTDIHKLDSSGNGTVCEKVP